jgi:hypothetical protein
VDPDPDPDPYGSAFVLVSWTGSGSTFLDVLFEGWRLLLDVIHEGLGIIILPFLKPNKYFV